MSEIKKICLTGIKSTGTPHWGNYLGAIKPAIEMANSGEYEGFFFIADYHSLTSVHDAKALRRDNYEVAATWIALGLDTKNNCLYQQSHIPEIMEFHWILSCFAAKGLMNRAHAYKACVQSNQELSRDDDQGVNMGMFTYPILMAADILFLQSDVVPVGADQLQHIEIARDLANAFNHNYGNIFKLPEAIVRSDALIMGMDGRKMSKSYNNYISLFLTSKKLRKTINKITTDSLPPEAPKDPTNCTVFSLYKQFASSSEVLELEAWYKRGIGWGEAKAELFKVVDRELEGPREIFNTLMEDTSKIDEILHSGAQRVRPLAQNYLRLVKEKIGLI